MSVILAPLAKQFFVDANGVPYAGGKLYTFIAGTNTPQATYTDSTGNAANPNPIILDGSGRANIWLSIGSSYKFVLQDVNGVQVWSVDNIAAGTTGYINQAFSATPTFDANSGTKFQFALQGNANPVTISNAQAGQTLTFILVQDGTGGWTFTWPASVKGGGIPDPLPNAVSVQTFEVLSDLTIRARSGMVSS